MQTTGSVEVNNLAIMNVGNKPIFVAKNSREVLDVTAASTYLSNYVAGWHLSDKESCSDHRHKLKKKR